MGEVQYGGGLQETVVSSPKKILAWDEAIQIPLFMPRLL
jgi:hypothetical protein